jgi:Fe-S cluster assembly ATP-binding protein
MLITHYTRILRYIKPDFVHVFVNGRVVEEGGSELADKLESEGYAAYVKDSNEQASLEKAAAEGASA